MRLAAALAWPLGRPVLDHRYERAGTPTLVLAVLVDRRLKAVAQRAAHVAGQRGVLAKGAGETLPARVRRHVGLGPEVRGDAHLAHLPGDAGSGLPGHVRIKGRGKCQVLRPVRAVGAVARVRREVNGNLVVRGLDVGLEAVGKLGLLERRVAGQRIQHSTHVSVEKRLLLVGDFLALDGALVGREAHEARDLLDREASGQVVGALLGGEAPVLVRNKLTGALEVLERKAVDLDELEPRLGGVGKTLPALLLNHGVAKVRRRLGIARTLGGPPTLARRLASGKAEQPRRYRRPGEKAPSSNVSH